MALHKHKRGIPKGSSHESGHKPTTKAGKQAKVGQVLGEFKRGTLQSSGGAKVTSRKQAVAIALSEASLARKDRSSHNTHRVPNVGRQLPVVPLPAQPLPTQPLPTQPLATQPLAAPPLPIVPLPGTHGVSDLVEPLPMLNAQLGHDHDAQRLMNNLRRGGR